MILMLTLLSFYSSAFFRRSIFALCPPRPSCNVKCVVSYHPFVICSLSDLYILLALSRKQLSVSLVHFT